MSISRFAALGLVCLLANACTVVVQPTADQPRPAPPATDRDADVAAADPEPVRRPPVQVPRRRPSNTDRDPRNDEADSQSRRPSARSNRLNLGIPPGHLPRPGECRVWIQGLPPGQQARARSCNGILATAPVGSWILYRPARYQRQVRVRYLHDARHEVIAVRAFDAETGVYLNDFALEEDDNNMGPVDVGPRRPADRPINVRPGNRGNSGNAQGQISTGGNRGTSGGNNGAAAGRGGTTRDQSSGEVGRGNKERDNRSANDSSNAGGTASGGGEVVTEQRRGGEPKAPLERNGVPEDTPLEREAQPSLGIHARYLPGAGQCRVWMPGLAYGRQARSASCDGITDEAPAGAWILRRPAAQPDVIQVDYVHEENAGVIVRTSRFDAASGAALRSTQ